MREWWTLRLTHQTADANTVADSIHCSASVIVACDPSRSHRPKHAMTCTHMRGTDTDTDASSSHINQRTRAHAHAGSRAHTNACTHMHQQEALTFTVWLPSTVSGLWMKKCLKAGTEGLVNALERRHSPCGRGLSPSAMGAAARRKRALTAVGSMISKMCVSLFTEDFAGAQCLPLKVQS